MINSQFDEFDFFFSIFNTCLNVTSSRKRWFCWLILKCMWDDNTWTIYGSFSRRHWWKNKETSNKIMADLCKDNEYSFVFVVFRCFFIRVLQVYVQRTSMNPCLIAYYVNFFENNLLSLVLQNVRYQQDSAILLTGR